jgi:putative endonuclease
MPAQAGIQYSAAFAIEPLTLWDTGSPPIGERSDAVLRTATAGTTAVVRLGAAVQHDLAMSRSRSYYVYVLASGVGGTLYVGVTNDLVRRIYEHRTKVGDGFTKKYDVSRLVYFEVFDDIENAIIREKRLKKWNRAWKVRMIEENNPNWDDLYPVIAVP